MGFLAAPAAPAIIGAVGTLGSALVGSRSQGKATDASLQATREALAYQKQQDALERAQAEQHLAATIAARNQLLQRYGIPFQYPGMGQQPGAMPPGAVPRGAGMTVADLAMRGKPVNVPGEIPGGLAWNDWRRYGLGGQQ